MLGKADETVVTGLFSNAVAGSVALHAGHWTQSSAQGGSSSVPHMEQKTSEWCIYLIDFHFNNIIIVP
jgi:hypothetical protein